MLFNLIGNAVKYTVQGSIVVSADATGAGNGMTLTLEVADTGIGIAPEDQARIFDPFVQVGNKRAQKGTGLGLAITRAFVQLMGGSLSLQSTLGSGSAFRVEVPVDEIEESAAEVSEVEHRRVVGLAAGQPDYRILIVEDKRENWMLLERILQNAGFQVRMAESGEQSVDLFASWRPHFIWMDLRLPGINGVEATRRIRDLGEGSKVKIAAVTASPFSMQRDAVLAAGLDEFLRKPYRTEEIFDCMARHLGVRYVYVEDLPRRESALSLPPEPLVALPQELREQLAEALVRLDVGPIAAAIGRVSEYDAALGSLLVRYADQSAYSPILEALESVNLESMRDGILRDLA